VPSGYAQATSGSISASASQKIDGKRINGSVTLNGDNVTISNTRITGSIAANGHKGLTLINVDLGPDSCPGSSSGTQIIHNTGGFTLKNTRIHHNPDDLLRVGGGTFLIQDSIVNGGCFYPNDHLDAIQFYDPGGVGKITIIHSIIDVKPVNNSDSGNAAIFFADQPGSGTVLTMYNNKFNGGQVTTALYDAPKGSGVIYDVHDNLYTNSSSCNRGRAAVASIMFDGTSGVKFTNNKYENGSTVTCPTS
jgi:hypothetical protein